jgi:hypothetical protein
MQILKALGSAVSPMSQQLAAKGKEPLNEEESQDSGAKASYYALINRPSPPF